MENRRLVNRILYLARKGVHRREIMNDLDAHASRKSIAFAISTARKRGMRSLAYMRDDILGTYYQFDGEETQ